MEGSLLARNYQAMSIVERSVSLAMIEFCCVCLSVWLAGWLAGWLSTASISNLMSARMTKPQMPSVSARQRLIPARQPDSQTTPTVAIPVHLRSRTSAMYSSTLHSCQWLPPSLSTRALPSTIETYLPPSTWTTVQIRASKLCCPSPVCRAAWMPVRQVCLSSFPVILSARFNYERRQPCVPYHDSFATVWVQKRPCIHPVLNLFMA
ncbi:hypothetical protein BKA81DRAFT_223755 [Phyllosticta paracitricarpa]